MNISTEFNIGDVIPACVDSGFVKAKIASINVRINGPSARVVTYLALAKWQAEVPDSKKQLRKVTQTRDLILTEEECLTWAKLYRDMKEKLSGAGDAKIFWEMAQKVSVLSKKEES